MENVHIKGIISRLTKLDLREGEVCWWGLEGGGYCKYKQDISHLTSFDWFYNAKNNCN